MNTPEVHFLLATHKLHRLLLDHSHTCLIILGEVHKALRVQHALRVQQAVRAQHTLQQAVLEIMFREDGSIGGLNRLHLT